MRGGLALLTILIGWPSAVLGQARPDEADVRRLLADPKALAEAFAHCNPAVLGMDRDCRAATEARCRQFFGSGPAPYTPQPVDPFPYALPVQPQPRR